MAEREGLERVVSEAQLRPGMLVELRACTGCAGGCHRLLLLRREEDASECPSCGECIGWEHPGDQCGDVLCTLRSIEEGRLYIVNPFAEDSSSTTQKVKRPREVSRAR